MLQLFHHTAISLSRSEFRYDEILKDKVYTKIRYGLVTHEISLRFGTDPRIKTEHVLVLPPPVNFIPFKDVDERVVLKWIHDLVPELPSLQKHNTRLLRIKYEIHDNLD